MQLPMKTGPGPLKLDQPLRQRVARNLSRFEVIEQDRRGHKHAAVAFTLVDCSEPAAIANIPHLAGDREQAAFILTTRAARLSSHPGQRAYPGGRIDPGWSKARLRQTWEDNAPKRWLAKWKAGEAE